MDIMSIYVFYLVYPCGLILKNCNLLHYKAYLHRLVHDFVVFLSFIVIFNCYYQNKYFYSILMMLMMMMTPRKMWSLDLYNMCG